MAIMKRILFRIASMDRKYKAEELISIIRNMDDDKFEVSILLDRYEGVFIKDIPADIKVMSLIKHHVTGRIKTLFCFLEPISISLQLQFYHLFPSRVKHKVKRVPDVEVAFGQSSLRALLKNPFKGSGKVCWYHADLKHQYTSFYTKRLFRMICSCGTEGCGYYGLQQKNM